MFIPAAASHARSRVRGAVCRALQDSTAPLSAHHHHHYYSLRFGRNGAGPLPARRPAASSAMVRKGGSPRVCMYASGPVHCDTLISRYKPPPSPAAALSERQVNRASSIQSPPTSPSFSCQHPPPPRQSASCAVSWGTVQ